MKKFIKILFTPIALFALTTGFIFNQNVDSNLRLKAATSVTLTPFTAVSGNIDSNFAYTSFKGGAGTAPALNNGDIRLYQNGGYITVSPKTASNKLTSITIANNNNSDGKGPFTAHYILDGEVNNTDPSGWVQIGTGNLSWTGTSYTYTNAAGFTHFKLVATGTSSSTRVYVDSISITYDIVGGEAVEPTGITIDGDSSIQVIEGETKQLSATITPGDATNKNILWSSSDVSKVTVSTDGLVTALATTSAPVTIFAKTYDEAFSDSLSVTVVADPYALVASYSFDGSGNESWSTSTGMGAYFTNGYGVASAGTGGSIISNMLLEDVVVGSQIKVIIGSVTNHATNTTVVTVHGLDFDGSRISGVSGDYTNPNKGDGTDLPTLMERANNNKGVITLQVSNIKKIYGLEVVFESSSSRSLLASIEVRSKLSTDEIQASAYANLVNLDVGLDAFSSCESILSVLNNDYSLLSSGAKAIFNSSSDSEFVSARARIAYLQAWVLANPTGGSVRIASPISSSSTIMATIVIGIIGITSLIGYYFVSKKNRLQ